MWMESFENRVWTANELYRLMFIVVVTNNARNCSKAIVTDGKTNRQTDT